jgi:hypothetical protein
MEAAATRHADKISVKRQSKGPQRYAYTEAMGRIAKLLGVPSGIVERMVSTPASQMFWLNGANFVSMGAVINDGK